MERFQKPLFSKRAIIPLASGGNTAAESKNRMLLLWYPVNFQEKNDTFCTKKVLQDQLYTLKYFNGTLYSAFSKYLLKLKQIRSFKIIIIII